jgi:hypothetical protein
VIQAANGGEMLGLNLTRNGYNEDWPCGHWFYAEEARQKIRQWFGDVVASG